MFKAMTKALYSVMKLLPVKRQVCFFSRQSDSVPLDFKLIIDQLEQEDVEIRIICNRFSKREDGMLRFCFNQFRSLLYLARSQVCVIDSYWPVVSVLNHKKDLTVIQIWHSIGKIKKSGYQNVGRECGRSKEITEIMCMHKNYDYVIAGGKAWDRYYCEAFNITTDKIRNYGLPRLDYILNRKRESNEFLEKHRELKNKKLIFYAPTYRTYPISSVEQLSNCFKENDDYRIIYRPHPRQVHCNEFNDVIDGSKENLADLFDACQYFITDYSSLALEASLFDKKTLYYLFDDEKYKKENGCNIDLIKEMPEVSSTNENDIYEIINENKYPENFLETYRKKYLPEELGNSTSKIAGLIMENLK